MATFTGTQGNDRLTGTDGIDILLGLAGDDVLNGGAGGDFMDGGVGNDTYIVDSVFDSAVEIAGAGNDTVASLINFDLGQTPHIENLFLVGQAATIGRGNALDNVMRGSDQQNVNQQFYGLGGNDTLLGGGGNDYLDGGVGNDTMRGGAGDDGYNVDSVGDIVDEQPNAGSDIVVARIDYTLGAAVENLDLSNLVTANLNGTGNDLNNMIFGNDANNILKGAAGNDRLYGDDGDDTLEGGSGDDRMTGGQGNDLYIVDGVVEEVNEEADQGIDTVQSSVSFTLTPHVENLILTGSGNIDGTGNELDNELTGNSGNNTLIGERGNDTISGGAGNDNLLGWTGDDSLNGGVGTDALSGGVGNDTYFISDTLDTITENAGEGNDTVNASVSYTLGAHVENLILTGNDSINATGNDLDNRLTGNAGNNTLDGKGGKDRMAGGAGDDVYVVDDAGDLTLEIPGAGIDTVNASVSHQLFVNVEHLILTGTADINGEGNDLDNRLIGNAGVNTLAGAAGNDILMAGAGNDILNGGAGADQFVLNAPRTGVDRVQDFNKIEGDKLVVDVDDFAGLRAGVLGRGRFVVGKKALDRNDRFIYNQKRGALFYDADGSGRLGAVQIASFDSKPALAASDILIVAAPF